MADPSLRIGLILRLGSAVVVLLVLDAFATYWTALYFANRVYDRWLVDSARSLAQAVHADSGRISFDLPPVALAVFQYDEVDKTYFKIATTRRGVIAGDTKLPDAAPVAVGDTSFADGNFTGQAVRVVTARLQLPGSRDNVTISVAETLKKRASLAREVLVRMVAPQITLLVIALLFAWTGVSRGLKPLTDLAAQLEARGRDNLTPVPEANLPSETRALVQRLNELLARLSQAMRAQQRFVTDAAHQLRTPLAAVLLHTERAERATDTASERDALHALHRSVERATRLSQQLLALARAEPDAPVAQALQPVDLTALARRVGEEWIPRALEHDIDFGLVVPSEPVMILGDEALLSEMLANLIDNAFRYGRRPGQVSVIVTGGSRPTLAVHDNGPGIPPEERHKIFERFYRVPGSEGQGCGLGLAIVAQIARSHEATVDVTTGSKDGGGCRFFVTFNHCHRAAVPATSARQA